MNAANVCEITKEDILFLQSKAIEINVASEAILDWLKQKNIQRQISKVVDPVTKEELEKIFKKPQTI